MTKITHFSLTWEIGLPADSGLRIRGLKGSFHPRVDGPGDLNFRLNLKTSRCASEYLDSTYPDGWVNRDEDVRSISESINNVAFFVFFRDC